MAISETKDLCEIHMEDVLGPSRRRA